MYQIKGLDGIRALAVIAVVLTHLHVFKSLHVDFGVSKLLIASIDGAAGVQAFFVLSGFLITTLLLREQKNNGQISIYNFFVRRSLRIFPLYFLILFLVFVLHVTGEHVTNNKSLFFAAIYSYNFIPKPWYSGMLGHTWSLAVEEHFYLVWPFIFLWLSYCYRKLTYVAVGFIAFSFVLTIVLHEIDWLVQYFFIGRWSFIAGSSIALGALLSLLLNNHNFGSSVRSILSSRWTLLLSVCLIFNQLVTYELHKAVYLYLRAIGFTGLIGWIYLNQTSYFTRFLEIPPLKYLGKVSYGVYMYQGFFLSTGPFRMEGQTWPLSQEIGLVLLVIVVPLSYHFFEKPVMNLKKKYQRTIEKKTI